MNQDASTSWPSMLPDGEDEFANFLDFTDLNLDFNAFDPSNHGDGAPYTAPNSNNGHENVRAEKNRTLPQEMDGTDIQSTRLSKEGNTRFPDSQSQRSQPQIFDQAGVQPPYYPQNVARYHIHGAVPPTPNSMEMHGAQRHFSGIDQQHARANYDIYTRKQQDQMVFTPLVSPAVTPLDTQYQVPDYAVPGEYLSPLTSPALQAQSQVAQHSVYGRARESDKSETTSPVDATFDKGQGSGPISTLVSRKTKRKSTFRGTRPPSRSVRHSPAMKPTRKKQVSSAAIPAKDIAEIMEGVSASIQPNGFRMAESNLVTPGSQNTSESGSISPEPLSEILMPPPATPRPRSAGRSPALEARKDSESSRAAPENVPATPASLMKITKSGDKEKNGLPGPPGNMNTPLKELSLPGAAVASRNGGLSIDTHMDDDQATPTLSAHIGSQSAPVTASTPTLLSPATGTMTSKTNAARNPDPKPLAKGKKRNSSSQPSPALRPRTSPSIKPLLPEGASVNAEASALLLASKSNYQNIIEGTHLPGVSYPETLSENLSSKRTSHKLAEQGRRNRINTALQEIAGLLPASKTTQSSGGGGGDAGGAQGTPNSSKASTVEMAIDYIKALQAELKGVKGELDAVRGGLKIAEGKLEVAEEKLKAVKEKEVMSGDGSMGKE